MQQTRESSKGDWDQHGDAGRERVPLYNRCHRHFISEADVMVACRDNSHRNPFWAPLDLPADDEPLIQLDSSDNDGNNPHAR